MARAGQRPDAGAGLDAAFGTTTSIAKLLLGIADPLLLAGLLYRRIDRCDGHAGRWGSA